MDRRTFIAATASTPLATIGVSAETQTVQEKLCQHVQEFRRLLKATAPEGMYVHIAVMFVGGNILANAYPHNWDGKQPHAVYNKDIEGWELTKS